MYYSLPLLLFFKNLVQVGLQKLLNYIYTYTELHYITLYCFNYPQLTLQVIRFVCSGLVSSVISGLIIAFLIVSLHGVLGGIKLFLLYGTPAMLGVPFV